MEWSDFDYNPLEESLYALLSPQLETTPKSSEWTREENNVFENALAEMDPSCPAFFENVASKVPFKSAEQIKLHYQAMVNDVELIESGCFPVPDYPTVVHVEDKGKTTRDRKREESQSSSTETKIKSGQPRRRGVPWTEEEHQLFLMGLNKYGKGDWRSISRYYVISKTPTQVASHAQKYFRRQTSSTPVDRRRPSIHDIHTVNRVAATSSLSSQPLPFSTCRLIPSFSAGGIPTFLPPMNPGFPSAVLPVFNNQTVPAAYPMPSSCFIPSLTNQNWG